MKPVFWNEGWTGRASLLTLGLATALLAAAGLGLAPRPLAAWQGNPPAPAEPAEVDTTIDADEFQVDDANGIYIAIGSVVINSPRGTMKADRARLKKTAEGGIDWVEGTGNVYIEEKGKPAGPNQPAKKAAMIATGDRGEYHEREQKANLTGNVVLRFPSDSLAEPAVVTGARADINLKTEDAVISRSSAVQAKAVLKPKGRATQVSQPAAAPETIILNADKIVREAQANKIVATGNPSLVRGKMKVTGDKISFTMDPNTDDLKDAQIDGHVVLNTEDEKETLHATGDRAVYVQATEQLTVSGKVRMQQKLKSTGELRTASGETFDYNLKTKQHALKGGAGGRSTIRITPNRPATPRPPAGAGTDNR